MTTTTPTIEVTTPQDLGEADRATIHANGIVVDVIANDDGSVYIECYAYEGRKHQAVVDGAYLDRYSVTHPHLRLTLADRP